MWEVLSFSDAQETSNNLISNGIIMIIGFHIFFPFVLCLCPFAFHSARYGRPNNMSHPNTTSPGEETKMIWWVEQTAYAASNSKIEIESPTVYIYRIEVCWPCTLAFWNILSSTTCRHFYYSFCWLILYCAWLTFNVKVIVSCSKL